MPILKTKEQRKLMGMAYAYKKGELDTTNLSAALIAKLDKIANGYMGKDGKFVKPMSNADLKAMASVKDREIPKKIITELKYVSSFNQFINESLKI